MPDTNQLATTDQRVTHVLWMTTVLAVFLVGVAVLLVPATYSARNNSDLVARATDLQSCRAELNAQIDVARTDALVATAQLDLITSEALEAIQRRDPDALAALLAEAPEVRSELADAQEHIRAATNAYVDGVELARTDPDEFLDRCHA